jgi:hypothetical protein
MYETELQVKCPHCGRRARATFQTDERPLCSSGLRVEVAQLCSNQTCRRPIIYDRHTTFHVRKGLPEAHSSSEAAATML